MHDHSIEPGKRVILLVSIMVFIVLVVETIAIGLLYHTAVSEEKERLREAAQSQARVIEAIARFDNRYAQDYPFGARKATLRQIEDAHSYYSGFGDTGEFTLAEKKDNQIIFLLNHRHGDLNNPKPVTWNSGFAEPMQQALSGKSGTIVGDDYRGVTVLAAYEPVGELNLGIVAKIDLSEIRAPFITASLISGTISIILIILGVRLFLNITNPILKELQETVTRLETALKEVKTLKGILPICSYCKKIRDDEGHWNQMEVFVKNRSEADFSHGICPDCLKQYYPEYSEDMKNKK